MTNLNPVTIEKVTQSLLALIIVAGGGVLMYIEPAAREAVAGVSGVIVGYYFNRITSNGNGGSTS